MEITNLKAYNILPAIKGLRNSYQTLEKLDSYEIIDPTDGEISVKIGSKDLELAQKMIDFGGSNEKYLRQIFVSMDIKAPLYWWKECDQYKIGTTTNSESTMHTLAKNPITKDNFQIDIHISNIGVWKSLINDLETLRQEYIESKDIQYWRELIQLLASSWLQKRTWTANYEVLRNIIQQRKNHKLSEWNTFILSLHQLPYSKELLFFFN